MTELEKQIADKLAEHWIDEHEMAAGYHYAILDYMEEHPEERGKIAVVYGNENWHDHWYWIHDFTSTYIKRHILE